MQASSTFFLTGLLPLLPQLWLNCFSNLSPFTLIYLQCLYQNATTPKLYKFTQALLGMLVTLRMSVSHCSICSFTQISWKEKFLFNSLAVLDELVTFKIIFCFEKLLPKWLIVFCLKIMEVQCNGRGLAKSYTIIRTILYDCYDCYKHI